MAEEKGATTTNVADGEQQQQQQECPWCRYMKGGACKETFEAWQACVHGVMGKDMDEGARQAAIDSCSNVTQPLFECMMRHRDYYGPQLASMGGGGGGDGSSGGDAGGGGGGGGDDPSKQPHQQQQQHSSSSSQQQAAAPTTTMASTP